jgi:hypothetical protein
MTEHTPGPWVRSPKAYDTEDWSPTRADAEWIVLGSEREDLPVAIICGDYIVDDSARLEANARLITAAPDMLAALKEARGLLDGILYPECFAQICAAIAKAEGQS